MTRGPAWTAERQAMGLAVVLAALIVTLVELWRLGAGALAWPSGLLLAVVVGALGVTVALALLVLILRGLRSDAAQRPDPAAMSLEVKRLTAIIAAQNRIATDFKPESVRELLAQHACLVTGAAGALVDMESAGEARGANADGALLATALAAPTEAVLGDDGEVVDGRGQGSEVPAATLERLHARSLVTVPMVCLGRRLGTLSVFSPIAKPFAPEAIGDLQILAGFSAAALAHATELAAKRDAVRELRQAKEAADTASGAKSEFLASMSHELRTPLNSIIGFSEILHDQRFGPLNSRQTRYVENVLSGGQHLLQLVNDVLDLSKVESGRMELHRAPIKLRELMSEAVAVVQPLANSRQVEIDVAVPFLRASLIADPGKLKQILFNLLSNAVKFTPNGGKVRVEAQAMPAAGQATGEGGTLLISVADSGVGIAEKDQQRVFEAFEQGDSPLAREHLGTGLGLAVARKLVELHGGRIWVDSAGVGEGSCFRFTLPLAAPVGTLPPPRATAEEMSGPPHRGASDVRLPLVLVVEDEPEAREFLRLSLREAGYEVVEATNAADAMVAARTRLPQAIALDLLLPKDDGWRLMSDLRADAATCTIPVIVVSVKEDGPWAHSSGAEAVVVKPIDRELLVGLVGELTGTEWRAADG